jgi:hypothetical protein
MQKLRAELARCTLTLRERAQAQAELRKLLPSQSRRNSIARSMQPSSKKRRPIEAVQFGSPNRTVDA